MKENQTVAQFLGIKSFPYEIKNEQGKRIYAENSDGFWWRAEYDSNGNEIYVENSDGSIIDNRPNQVELTLTEIASKLNIPVELLRIKE